MKLNIDNERFLAAVDRAGDCEVGVGSVAFDPVEASVEDRVLVEGQRFEPTHLAFGRLVQLLRRQKSLTVERLAEQARIEMEEVLQIETNVEFRPDQRTVFQLAQVFELHPKALMQLSGNAIPREEVTREAMRFAASSEPMEKLSREETEAVEIFVSALNRLADKKMPSP